MLWIAARQAPLSIGLFQQEYWNGLPFPSPGDLPDPGIEPESTGSPALKADCLPLSHWGSTSAGEGCLTRTSWGRGAVKNRGDLGPPPTLLVGSIFLWTPTKPTSTSHPQKVLYVKNSFQQSSSAPGYIHKKLKSGAQKGICIPMLITALVTKAKRRK